MGRGRYSSRLEAARNRIGSNIGGATSRRNTEVERESDLARLDRVSEDRANLEARINNFYRPGTENLWYDRTTGQEVPFSEVQALTRRLEALNREWERLVARMP